MSEQDNKESQTKGEGIQAGIDHLEERRKSKEGERVEGKLRGQKARGGAEKVITRTISGALYAIVILACLYLGPVWTAGVIAIMSWLNCSEFFRMARMTGRMPNEVIGLTAAAAFPLVALTGDLGMLMLSVLGLVIACAIWYVATPRATIGDVALSVFGPVYTALMYSSIVIIRRIDAGNEGALLTLGVMGSVWVNDAAAYFVGSRFGKHKLAPQISPNKSIEGFWGGLAGSVLIWAIVAILKVEGIGFAFALPVGAIVGFSGVVGDLFESRIKRGVGVKDSGNIIPGHGGMLDRSDSMLFAGSIACLALKLGGFL